MGYIGYQFMRTEECGMSRKVNRRKVQRPLWLPPDVDAALVEAAGKADRDITRQATIYFRRGLIADGFLPAEEAPPPLTPAPAARLPRRRKAADVAGEQPSRGYFGPLPVPRCADSVYSVDLGFSPVAEMERLEESGATEYESVPCDLAEAA